MTAATAVPRKKKARGRVKLENLAFRPGRPVPAAAPPGRAKRTAVDLFAGGGGFSTAAKKAGCEVLAAVNHEPIVVAVHAANHPETMHGCYKLNNDTNYAALPDHDILLASPCCQGHAKANGVKPGSDADHKYDESRATLLAVTSTVHAKHPKAVIVENVPEVRNWGGDGSRYRWWLDGFRVEGYHVSENVLESADFGAASRRERMYIVMVHESVADGPVTIKSPGLTGVPARDVIDRTGKYEAKMKPVANKCLNTRLKVERLKAGRMRDEYEWVFCYRGRGTGLTMNETIGTITTHEQWCYVRGDRMRFLAPEELRAAMGFPADYILPRTINECTMFMGNAVEVTVASAVIGAVMDVLDAADRTGGPVRASESGAAA